MVYARVSDPLLRQDYYQGSAALDISSENQTTNELARSQHDLLRRLIQELKMPGLETTHRYEMPGRMKRLLENDY